jgi:hypothetical protein
LSVITLNVIRLSVIVLKVDASFRYQFNRFKLSPGMGRSTVS